MKNFISIDDVDDPISMVEKVFEIKRAPLADTTIGRGKVLGLVFFNSSLRTRMSTTRAAYNLGMNVIVLNVSSDSWQLEFEDGAIMDQGAVEHVKEAVPVMTSYCDILGVRSFPGLENRDKDYQEEVLHSFVKNARCPVINLESSTLHPLQSLTDLFTIEERKQSEKPKVVLTWAPHPKSLPQSVANSFAQWMKKTDYDFTIVQPKGLELPEQFTRGAKIECHQEKALAGADFLYVKNWSSYHNYGAREDHPEWTITSEKLALTNSAKVMHCLPVRRNVVIADDVIDGANSIVVEQAENRLYAAQAVLKEILKNQQK